MTKLNKIQDSLTRLNGGQFQKMMDEYFFKKYKVYSIGSVLGDNNPRKGTPDSLIFNKQNHSYIMIEYTIQKSNLVKKLEDDILSCLDYQKTGITKEKIGKIICCYLYPIKPAEIEYLYQVSNNHGVHLELMSGDIISQELKRYPTITKEHLNIKIDTGQFLDIEDFVRLYNNNKYSTSIDNRMYGREEELTQILSAINNYEVTVLSGDPGVGKTELALKALKKFQLVNPGFIVKCFRSNNQNFYEDLQAILEYEKKLLILIDDANQLTTLDLFIDELANEDIEIKYIMTVRNYAFDLIMDKLTGLKNRKIEVQPLQNDDIIKICENEFEIRNQDYSEYIVNLAQGNARLAVMIAESNTQSNKVNMKNPGEIIEIYFKSVEKDFKNELNEKNLLKTAAIISFLGSVNLKDTENMKLIRNVINLNLESFEDSINKLHQMEIIDIYKDHVVKVSDQILSTYIFYNTVFDKKYIDYSMLIKGYFPKLNNRIINHLNSVLFYYNEQVFTIMKKEIKKVYDEEIFQKSDKSLFIKTFWFALDTIPLIYAKDKISNMAVCEKKNISYDIKKNDFNRSDLLDLICNYSSKEYKDEAFELIILYLNKKPNHFKIVYDSLIQGYGYNYQSLKNNYKQQYFFMKKMIESYKKQPNQLNKMMLLRIAQYFLKFTYENTQLTSSNEVSFYRFSIPENHIIFKIRELAWEVIKKQLFDSSTESFVLKNLRDYGNGIFLEETSENIIKFDRKIIINLIEKIPEFDLYKSIVFGTINDYFNRFNLQFNCSIKKKYETKKYQMYIFLSDDSLINEKSGRDSLNQILRERAKTYCLYDFTVAFDIVESLLKQDISDKLYFLTYNLSFLLEYSDEKNLPELLKEFFKRDIQINLIPNAIIQRYINIYSARSLKEIIEKYEFHNKDYWLFTTIYLEYENNINMNTLNELYVFFKDRDLNNNGIWPNLRVMSKYLSLDSNVFIKITKEILKKEDNIIQNYLSKLLNLYAFNASQIIDMYSNNLEILKEAYTKMYQLKSNFDYNGEIFKSLVKSQITLIDDLVSLVIRLEKVSYTNDNNKFNFLWDLKNSCYISYYYNQLLKHKDESYYIEVLMNNFFKLTSTQKKNDKYLQQDLWLKEFISRNYKNNEKIIFLFKGISQLSDERRIDAIKIYLNHNCNIEDFKKIQLESNNFSWSGSEIPLLIKRKEFYVKLKNKIRGLKYIEHKEYLESNISSMKRQIEKVEIMEFMQDI